MTSLFINASTHEVDKVRVSDLDQSDNLSLKLLREVIFSQILPIVRKFKLFDGNIVLFVGRFKNVGAGARSDLLLKVDVAGIDPEVVLPHLKLLRENAARLLRLGHLARVNRSSRAKTAATLEPVRIGRV